jgi:transcriptional regulator with XRE-family HTH domain
MNSPFIFQLDSDEVRRLWVDAARRADAMGVMGFDEAATLDAGTADRLVTRAREAGVASVPRLPWSSVTPPTAHDIAALLRLVISALEGSPVPRTEWPSLSRVFDAEQLARLVGVSLSSLRRYQSGERDTPDPAAERLHCLALIVADLAGSYNNIGMRRWFERPRTALGGKAPAALLKGEWDPEGPGAQKVRQLARSLVAFSAT